MLGFYFDVAFVVVVDLVKYVYQRAHGQQEKWNKWVNENLCEEILAEAALDVISFPQLFLIGKYKPSRNKHHEKSKCEHFY